MKEQDYVEVTVEKEAYAKYGVHKGMQGQIRCTDGTVCVVNFPQSEGKQEIAEISVKKEDMRRLPEGMDARVNERIRAAFGEEGLQVHILKEMDCVEVTVEKEVYARDGVHKGMQGWICYPISIDETWLVNFPQCGARADIETIGIAEADMKEVPVMYAIENERIKAWFDRTSAPPESGPCLPELDCVMVWVENEAYAKHGVHKGMRGRICRSDEGDGTWRVMFMQDDGSTVLAELDIDKCDLEYLPDGMDTTETLETMA